jgi:hypothetical protein
MPAKAVSDEPAMEGPARMKAKARMKLTVRIDVSGFGCRLCRPSRWRFDNERLFPDICATSRKWFRYPGELFRRVCFDETLG